VYYILYSTKQADGQQLAWTSIDDWRRIIALRAFEKGVLCLAQTYERLWSYWDERPRWTCTKYNMCNTKDCLLALYDSH
jgi:hypothetical protein